MYQFFNERDYRRVNWRIIFTAILMVLAYLFLFWKLYQVHVRDSPKYKAISRRQYTGEIILKAHRGEIFDRNGLLLAFSEDAYSLALRPKEIKDIKKVIDVLTSYGIPKERILRAYYSGYPFAYVLRKAIDQRKAEKIRKAIYENDLKGVILESEYTGRRIYTFPSLEEVVGIVNIDGKGADGIEMTMDKQLSGRNGFIKLEFDGMDNPIYYHVLSHVPPRSGSSLYLTVDANLQTIVKDIAKKVLRDRRAEEVCIMVAKRDGRVLAMVSLLSEKNPEYRRTGRVFGNTCLTWGFEPGSTFKPITIAAAVDSGLKPYDTYFSGPALRLGKWVIFNADDNLWTKGFETMEDIIKYSFNIGTATVAIRLGGKRFQEYLQKFGFYQLSGIQLNGEAKSKFPDYSWDPTRIYLATSSYGQGISVNMAQLLRAYIAFANDGLMPEKLTILEKVVSPDGEVSWKYEPVYRRVISRDTAILIRKFLRSVVEGGTGRRAELIGYWPGGKTGTANQARGGEYKYYTASFIGMFPINSPEYIIAVRVSNPEGKAWGGLVAAPVFREVAIAIAQLYNLSPEREPVLRIPPEFQPPPKGKARRIRPFSH